MKLTLQIFRLHILFSRLHLICISADRIDFPIMYDKPIRMCSLPAWVRVGTEPGMNKCNGRIVIRALQILKERTKLPY